MKCKTVFVGHDLKFICDFIDYLSQQKNTCWPKVATYKGHTLNLDHTAREAIEECDVIFCEWALDNAVRLSNQKPHGKRLIIRLHAQELRIFKNVYLDKIDWSKVDALIVISPAIKERIISLYPEMEGKIFYVPNYVPMRKISDIKNAPDLQFRLGIMGIVPALKRVDLAFELLLLLRNLDPRYTLSIKGGLPNDYHWMKNRTGQMKWYDRTFFRYKNLVDDGIVVFEGASDEVASWYQRVGVILSMSDSEGSHQAVAEGMASGCVPVIRSWHGARQLYGDPVFDDLKEMAEFILSLRAESTYRVLSNRASNISVSMFNFDGVSKKLLEIIG